MECILLGSLYCDLDKLAYNLLQGDFPLRGVGNPSRGYVVLDVNTREQRA